MLGIASELYLFAKEDALNGLVNPQDDAAGTSNRPTHPTILVVDDQQMIADTTAMVLNRFGFRATRAYSGDSALEMAVRLRPDYLLTDILMPGLNGVDLAIAIREQLPATIIVLISGQAGISDVLRQAKDDGYEFDLLAKPIHPEKLLEHLRRKAPRFWEREG